MTTEIESCKKKIETVRTVVTNPESHSEPSQAFNVELFAQSFQLLTIFCKKT